MTPGLQFSAGTSGDRAVPARMGPRVRGDERGRSTRALVRPHWKPGARSAMTRTNQKRPGGPMLRTLTSAAALAFASALALAAPFAAYAADYPERPVHVLVGYAAGSGPDIQARLISHALSESLHQ